MSETKLAVTLPEGVLAVRPGPGANCSSVGSVVDMLFAAAVVAGVAYASVAASLADPEVEREANREADREADREGESDAPEEGPR